MQSPLVYIILLNYNNYTDTIECFESLLNITYQNYRIVIVDNYSPNASVFQLRKYFNEKNTKYFFYKTKELAYSSQNSLESLVLIQSGYNGGYSFGNNIGIRYAQNNNTDYVLLLNNDTIVDKYFLEPLVETCENDCKVGIASGKIYFHDKPHTIWFNGGQFKQLTASIKHYHFGENDIGQGPPENITFISGCMMLIPIEVIKNVGLFNEDYFMYIEDLEYSQRIINNGYTLKVCENSKISHKVGRSTGGQFTKLSIYLRTKNTNKFIYKNIDGIIRKIISFSIFNLRTLYKLMVNNKLSLVFDMNRGIIDSFREKQL